MQPAGILRQALPQQVGVGGSCTESGTVPPIAPSCSTVSPSRRSWWSLTTTVAFEDVPEVAARILAGEVRGRTVVTVGS